MIRKAWFLLLASVVLVIVIGVGALVHLRLRAAGSRLPERGSSSERVAGCPARVEVVLDRQGAPHIRTGSETALWFAQGYLHARDRFFQMELARRTAAGRLAEVLGGEALSSDRKMRVLRLAATARRQVAQLDADDIRVLESYSAGVNSAVGQYGRWIAPEIWLLGVDPEPWTPEDSLAIAMLLELDLSWAMGEELERGLELTRLGREKAVDLWGWTAQEARDWIPPGEGVRHPYRDHESITPPMGGFGSNAWAIASDRTSSGKPLLAADPHLGLQMPGTFAAVHLDGPGVHVAGLSIPGTPGVAFGHTEGVAWGFTVSMLDDQDLYVLTLDDSGTRELVDGRWQPLRTVTEDVSIRWRENPELVKVRVSVHGPLVREQRDEYLALAWSGYRGPSVLPAFLRMNRSQTVEELASAWDGIYGPSLNLIAADTGGSILHQVVGMEPGRRRGAGRLPAPGSDSGYAWTEFRSLAALRTTNPDDGFLISANHDIFTEGDYPESSRYPAEFAPPWRARRIRQVLGARSDWTASAALDLQGDVVSGRAIAVLKMLRPDLEAAGGPTAERLMSWDGRMDASSGGAPTYERLMLSLATAVGGDEASLEGLGASPIGPEELVRLLAGGIDEKWWDDVGLPGVQTRMDVISGVLGDLDTGGGRERWGDDHTVAFDHPLTLAPGIGWLLADSWNRGPFAIGGGNVTVNAQYWNRNAPFAVTTIPAARFVADVGAWDKTLLVLPIGQSGRPWSAHYADQIAPWIGVEGRVFPFTRDAVDAAAVARWEMVPDGPGQRLPQEAE